MLVLGTGRGSNYANRDILERTILKKKKGESGFPNLKIIYTYVWRETLSSTMKGEGGCV